MALTASFLFTMIVQDVDVYVSGRQLKDQPPNVDPGRGAAVRITGVPDTKLPVQPAPEVHTMPTGLLITVPVPRPTS